MTWTNLFLYLDILIAVVIVVLLVLITIKTNKYIKTVDKNRRDKIVDYIRKTSKHNKPPRKGLRWKE